MVKDALSRETAHSSALFTRKSRIQADFEQVGIIVAVEGIKAQLARLTIQLTLHQRIVDAQVRDSEFEKILNEMEAELADGYTKASDGGLLY